MELLEIISCTIQKSYYSVNQWETETIFKCVTTLYFYIYSYSFFPILPLSTTRRTVEQLVRLHQCVSWLIKIIKKHLRIFKRQIPKTAYKNDHRWLCLQSENGKIRWSQQFFHCPGRERTYAFAHYHKTCGRVSQTRGNGRGQHIRSVKMSPFLGKPPSWSWHLPCRVNIQIFLWCIFLFVGEGFIYNLPSREVRAETWGQVLKQKPQKNSVYCMDLIEYSL